MGSKACGRGHPRTPENTYVYPDTGKRQCRVCRREYIKERRRNDPAKRNANRQIVAARAAAAKIVAKNHPAEFTAVLNAERAKRNLPPVGTAKTGRPYRETA